MFKKNTINNKLSKIQTLTHLSPLKKLNYNFNMLKMKYPSSKNSCLPFAS